MSLINRICITNYANIYGSDRNNWAPLYTHNLLDLDGQSAIIVLDNGGGKTTLVNAVIGLLSRNRQLVRKMRERGCPARADDGSALPWSHIQVELLSPSTSPVNQDMLERAGGPVKGDTMVFGAAFHCDTGGIIYYCFPGRLEELPTFKFVNDEKCAIDNAEFQEAAKQVPRLAWQMRRPEWKKKMSAHFSDEMLQGLATFQLRGGQDRGAQIFTMLESKRNNKDKEKTLFYEVLAPELLYGLLEDESGDPDEGAIDKTLFNYLRRAATLRRMKEQREKEVREKEETLAELEYAGKTGRKAHDLLKELEKSRKRHAVDLAVMDEVVRGHPMPGIPHCASGDDVCSNLANRLVVIPGEHCPRVPDRVLANLLGIEVRHLNQAALRIGVDGVKNMQVIEIPCDSLTRHRAKTGPKPVYYTFNQARKILLKQGSQDLVDLLEDAIALFDRDLDTNPWREDLAAIEDQIDQVDREINRIRDEIPILQRKENDLQRQQKEAQVNEQAYVELESSGLFSKEELAEPIKIKDQVKQELERCEQEKNDFLKQAVQILANYEAWVGFCERFGQASPEKVKVQREKMVSDLKAQKATVKTDLEKCRKVIERIQESLESSGQNRVRLMERLNLLERLVQEGALVIEEVKERESPRVLQMQLEERVSTARDIKAFHQRRLEELEGSLQQVRCELEELKALKDAGLRVLERLQGDESPGDYENRLRREHATARQEVESASQSLKRARDGIAALDEFEGVLEALVSKWAPNADPLEWFSTLDDLRKERVLESQALDKEREELDRQHKALESEQLAATGEAHEALTVLGNDRILFCRLYEKILEMETTGQRKIELLDRFSPFLFAPVVERAKAESAARLLHEKGLSIPVFIEERLAAWCEEDVDGEYMAWQSVHTRTVDYLLNPELRQEEMARIEKRLVENRRLYNENEGLVADISPQGKLLQLWPAAEEARRERYRERLPDLERAHGDAANRLEHYDALLSEQGMRAIRDATDFWNRGGEERLLELHRLADPEIGIPSSIDLHEKLAAQAASAERFHGQILVERHEAFHAAIQFHREGGYQELETLRKELAAEEEKEERLHQDKETQERESMQREKELVEIEEELGRTFPYELRILLDQADKFEQLGGPAFLASKDERERGIEAALDRAKRRNSYEHTFQKAQKWVDYQGVMASKNGLEKKLAYVRQAIKESIEKRDEYIKSLEDLNGQRMALKPKIENIDNVALAILSRYSGIQSENGVLCDENEKEAHPVWCAVQDLRLAIQDPLVVSEDFSHAIDDLIAKVEALDLGEEIKRIRRLDGDLKQYEKDFTEKIRRIRETRQGHGLSESERSLLLEIEGAGSYEKFERFLQNYREVTYKEAEAVRKYANEGDKTFEKFEERIWEAIRGVNDALAALKSVAKQDPEGIKAHFDIDAKVVNDDGARAIIRDLVKAVDEEERHLEKVSYSTTERKDAEMGLRNRIRRRLCEGLFTDVSIRYVHEGIRPSGRTFSIGETVSTGEGAALGMMLMIRLAQFRIEREARRALTTIARRRLRRNAQTVMIMDGLFSTLSRVELVRSVVSSIPSIHGNFQLIGLVHDPKHQHDFESFPVLIRGQKNRMNQVMFWRKQRKVA